MSQRSKNLLEAFNRSKAPEKSAEPAPPQRGSTPRVGGPFADASPAPRAKAEPSFLEPRATAALPRERWRVVVLCAVIAVVFFFLGRVSVSTGDSGVQAAGDSPAGSPAATPPAAPPAARTPEDALRDPANQFTIKASTYKLSVEQKALATDARAHLVGLGFPAAVYENTPKKQIFLLIGAAPANVDLDGLLAKVRAATSKRGAREFTTAQVVDIDTCVLR